MKVEFKGVSVTGILVFLIATSLCISDPDKPRRLFDTPPYGQPQYCSTADNPPPGEVKCSKFEDILVEARGAIGDEDDLDKALPPWINLDLARKGQRVAKDYISAVSLGGMYGAIAIFVPDMTEIILFTKMADNATMIQQRFFAAFTQVFVWYKDILGDDNDEAFLMSIKESRQRHFAVAKAARKKLAEDGFIVKPDYYKDYKLTTALNGPFFEDLKNSDIPESLRGMDPVPPSSLTNITIKPFNQQTWALSQFVFAGYSVLWPERVTLTASDDEIWAFNHLWAVLSFAVGSEDKYNIGLQPNLEAQRVLYRKIHETFVVPSIFRMEKDRNTLCRAEITMMGFGQLTALANISPNLYFYLYLKHILRIPAPRTYETLTAYDKLLLLQIESTYSPISRYNPLQTPLMNGVTLMGMTIKGFQDYGWNYLTNLGKAKYVHGPSSVE